MSESAVQMYETRSGPMLALKADTYITRSLATYGEYCPNEWLMLSQIIKPGMPVVEVGANIGAHSVSMARACWPAPFYAFEPQQRVFQILCANLALNDIRNAHVYPEACGEAEGEATIPILNYEKGGNFGGVSLRRSDDEGVKVRVRALDSLDLWECGLLKIDVEGFETQVLRGARTMIERCRPTLYVENELAAHQGEVIALISEMGYQMYWHTPGLFNANNFKGVQENVFGPIGSVNMLCLPNERPRRVEALRPVDPNNWISPFATSP